MSGKRERQKVLDAAKARDLFIYEPKTGWLIRKKNNKRAGSLMKDGYRRVGVGGHTYMEHRLVFLMVRGRWPTLIDHINRIRDDNRIENLRECSPSQNNANNAHVSRSGLRGAVPIKCGSYQATIVSRGKSYYLGVFKTPEEAHAAYVAAAVKLHGEFASSASAGKRETRARKGEA